MTELEVQSPHIEDCSWGRVSIEGHGTVKDAKLVPGGARGWNWLETGTRHDPGIQPADVAELLDRGAEIIVLSTGVFRRLRVCPETLVLLKNEDIPCHILPTPKAVETYNLLRQRKRVGALIHSTC
ncbi:MAG: Mth938-like domain-containing protein [Hyphomicrobiales bacterium]|nr:Mth938-like domain-containing protein [Hyphomicrobiales bacterium]